MSEACFTAADILLPAAGVPLDSWACIAVDQFTSQPEYWQRAEHLADGKPSTLHIVLPEAYLGTPQEAERLESIRRTMEEYRKSVLTRKVHGYVYVERTQMDGTVRQGLVGAVDLDAYDYAKGSKPAIRPSESTVVERIPPRLKVRRGATLETPHVMMLADDADCTLIEPIGLMKNQLPPLYDGELMLGGGHLRGWAVEDPALIAGIDAALAALADPAAFARRWPAAKGQQPMVLAVGDGNHSLATAKAYWEELKPTLSEEQRRTHPARWCLAEVCNVHSPAIEIEPIHRVVFGVDAKELYGARRLGPAAGEQYDDVRPASAPGRCPRRECCRAGQPARAADRRQCGGISGGLPARPSRRDRGLHPRRKHGAGAGLRPGQTGHGHSAARLCEG